MIVITKGEVLHKDKPPKNVKELMEDPIEALFVNKI